MVDRVRDDLNLLRMVALWCMLFKNSRELLNPTRHDVLISFHDTTTARAFD